MIAANELRIGNWYKQLHTGAYTQVDLFLFHELYDDETYADHLQPIPLSPEILFNAGFQQISEENMAYPAVYHKAYTRVLVENSFDIQHRGGDWFWIEGNTIAELDYVHELQNLFRSLTQTELTIDLS